MDIKAVESYLHQNIPVTRAMGITVSGFDDCSVTLNAPLQPNLNHRHTAFGGSIATLGILAGWSLLYIRLQQYPVMPRIVIQHSSTDFIAAAETGFSASCVVPSDKVWQRFIETLQRKQRSRIRLVSEILANSGVVARHTGDFVAISAVDR